MAEHDSSAQMAPTRYFDTQFQCDAVKILPGEYFITHRELLIVTVLGSCVAACLRDRTTGIGGMNHFMLPDGEPCSGSARYGGYAMDVLIDHLLKLGAQRSQLEAKVFGGGHVMSSFQANDIGERNVVFALDYLERAGIPVAARDVLDVCARKVYFFPASGRVLVRKFTQLNNTTLLDREAAYSHKLGRRRASGDPDS